MGEGWEESGVSSQASGGEGGPGSEDFRPGLKCDSQDLTLHTMLSEGVATVRQTPFRGF